MKSKLLLFLCLTILFIHCSPENRTVTDVIDELVTKLYAEKTDTELAELSTEKIIQLLPEKDKKILATAYWHFDINTAATVSIMRHVDQAVVPFWLKEYGFERTELVVRNENYTYEVWQKEPSDTHRRT